MRQAQCLVDMMLVYRAVNKLTSSQKITALHHIHDEGHVSDNNYACHNKLTSDGMNGSKLTTKWLYFGTGIRTTRIRRHTPNGTWTGN